MLKSFVYIMLSSVLIFSILAPSVVNLLTETDTYIYNDTTEKEKSEKSEKDIEEKIIQLSYSLNALIKQSSFYYYYIENNSNHYSKIVLPPPEHII
jgi:peptidoglycan hydrolase CwlO-like protein